MLRRVGCAARRHGLQRRYYSSGDSDGSMPRSQDRLSWLKEDLGKRLAIFGPKNYPVPDIEINRDTPPQYVCSYSWFANQHKAIYVPAAPPKFCVPSLPRKLRRPLKSYYHDHATVKFPTAPYLPFFAALHHTPPPPDFFDTMDILVTRNILCTLLKFVKSGCSGDFRIDITRVKNTLVFFRYQYPRDDGYRWHFRMEQDGDEYDFEFGDAFTNATTSPPPGLRSSFAHHRAISYPIGNLKCVVLSQIDAWYEEGPAPEAAETEASEPTTPKTPQGAAVKWSSMRHAHPQVSDELASKSPIAVPPDSYRRSVFKDGDNTLDVLYPRGYDPSSYPEYPPQNQLAEVRTASAPQYVNDTKVLRTTFPHLWFGRINYLIAGLARGKEHTLIEEVRVNDATRVLNDWEKNNQTHLQRLVSLLTQVKEVVERDVRNSRWALLFDRFEDPPRVRLFKVKPPNRFPKSKKETRFDTRPKEFLYSQKEEPLGSQKGKDDDNPFFRQFPG